MASKSKKNNVKFKWTKELIALIAFVVVLTAVTVILAIPSKDSKFTKEYNAAIQAYNQTNSTSYGLLSNENVYKTVEYDDLKETLADEETVYVFYGSVNSSTFLQCLYNIDYYAQEEDVETVYILSSLWYEEAEDVEAEDFKAELNEKEDFLNNGKASSVEKFELSGYPALLVFENGKLTFNSQTYEDNDQASWDMIINKVFVKGE